MSRHVYHEIHLHMVWRTKDSASILVDHVESRCHHFLEHRALQSPGVIVHAVDGMPDHIHMVVSIPPTLLISDWIGQLKGASSFHINQEICNRKVLDWQTGYGVVSFGTKDLPWVINYVKNQKRHHAAGEIYDRLERISQPDGPMPEGTGEGR